MSDVALQPVRESSLWSVTVEDDGCMGFEWHACRGGVLWAKGWVRTRSIRLAKLTAQSAGAQAYADEVLR